MAKAKVTKVAARQGGKTPAKRVAQRDTGNPFASRQVVPPVLSAGVAAMQKAKSASKAKIRDNGLPNAGSASGGGGAQRASGTVNAKRNARGGMRPFSTKGGKSRGKFGE